MIANPLKIHFRNFYEFRFVIFIINVLEIAHLTRILHSIPESHRKYYAVVVNEPEERITEQWLIVLFQRFFRKHLLNVIVLYLANGQLTTYTYTPFENTLLKVLPNHLHKFDHLFVHFNRTLNMKRKPVIGYMFKDIFNAIYTDLRSKIYGVDGEFIDTFVERINGTKDFQSKYIFWPWNSYSSSNLDMQSSTLLEYSDYLERDDLCVIVRKTGEESSIQNFFKIFELTTGFLVFCFSLVFYLLLHSFYFYEKTLVYNKFLFLFGSFLEVSVLPSFKSSYTKFISLQWLFFTLILTTLFKAKLFVRILHPSEPATIDTFGDLMGSDKIPVVLFTNNKPHWLLILRAVKSDPLSSRSHFWKSLFLVEEEDEFRNLLRYGNSSLAFIETKSFLSFVIRNKNIPPYHLVEECIRPAYNGYMLPTGNFYLRDLNIIRRRCFEAGLFHIWRVRGRFQAKRIFPEFYSQTRAEVEQEIIMLQFKHLRIAFYFLTCGHALAAICFLIELLAAKYGHLYSLPNANEV